MNFNFPEMGMVGSFFIFWLLWMGLVVLVNIIFCAGVARDAGDFANDYGETVLVGPMF